MDTAQRRLPRRNPALLSREVDGEFVVVDEAASAAHQLTGPVAEVWRAIEGGAAPSLPDAKVDEIVDELSQLGLLVEPKGMTRRAMLQRTGVVVAATGLSTIALPAAVAHASTGVLTTTTLTVNPTNPAPGSTYTATVTVVRSTGGTPASGGTVELRSGTTVVASSVLPANGIATFTLTAPTTSNGETITYTAYYLGSTTYSPSTSGSTTVTLTDTDPSPSVLSITSTNGTGQMGAGDTLVITFSEPVTGFPTQVLVTQKRNGNSAKADLKITSGTAANGALLISTPDISATFPGGSNNAVAQAIGTVSSNPEGTVYTITLAAPTGVTGTYAQETTVFTFSSVFKDAGSQSLTSLTYTANNFRLF